MKKSLNTFRWVVVLVFLLSGCNLGMKGPPDASSTLNPLYTAAAQTVEAMENQGAITPRSGLATLAPLPGENPTTTPTLSFASPTPYLSPVPVSRCNAAAFIKDITIPDGSIITPGGAFTKTWRIKNVGTCSWTPSYALVFISGDGMNAPAYVSLPGSVSPGSTIDLTVNLVAPSQKGHYRGNWKLRNASGALFGIGALADTAFWVDINVLGPEFVAYDFVANACDANWRNNNGSLPCPGTEGDDDGYVIKLNAPRMENGTTETQAGLVTTPKHTAKGYIQGRYPAFKVQPGDHFLAKVNCQYKANNCDVLFRLEYKVGNKQVKTLKEWHEVYEGKYYSVDLDLSSLAGENVRFFLTVLANDSKGKDYALWLAPRIVRQGTPSATPTTTKTSTATATASPTLTSTSTPTETPSATATP
jgi:hypothetical protein